MWVARGRQGAAQKPGGSPICRTYHTTAVGEITCTAPWTAGCGSREWAGWPAALSQRPRGLVHSFTALSTGQSEEVVTAPLSPSHARPPALTKAARSVKPLEKRSCDEGGDDDAALQLQHPVLRRPQPLTSAHSQRASAEPPGASASQSSSASYASPRLAPTVQAPTQGETFLESNLDFGE